MTRRPSDGNIARFEKPLLGVGIVVTAVYALGVGVVEAVRRWAP